MKKAIVNFAVFLFAVCQVYGQEAPLWLRYPAISPDGTQIVFSYQGNLWKVAATGGTAVPLTLYEGQDFMPVWSHDGKHIAFASDRHGNFDVFVMPADGGPAKRLSFHSANDFPSDFSVDNKEVIFSSTRLDLASFAQNPNRTLPELYSVPVAGGREKIVTTVPAENARYDASGKRIIYHDRKGYEDPFRKHHTSSIARDIWLFDTEKDTYTQLTDFPGEDRNPLFSPTDNNIYFLSEASGSFNIHRFSIENPGETEQITTFTQHPVRFLTAAQNGLLCFSFDGEIYTLSSGSTPQKVNIKINLDTQLPETETVSISSGASEMALSPNGKEIAFVFRGEIFVTAVDNGMTKRITNTPEQERSVSFSPDGRSLVYAGERNGSWNVYQASIKREEEPYFYTATLVEEKAVVATANDEFQPAFSPDGKEVAYLEERVILKVANLASGQTRAITKKENNYSYSDGDQSYQWSPDGKWFLVQYLQPNSWIDEVGLVKADGSGEITNLTKSGFADGAPKWMMDGKMMIWFSDRDGMKNRGSWGAESDVYAMFFTQEAYDRFMLSEEEFDLLKEKEEDKDQDKKDDTSLPEVKIAWEGLDDRKARLTIHSSRLNDAVLSPKGDMLYYVCRFEKGIDLWSTNLRTKETKLLTKLGNNVGALALDKEGKSLFVLSDGAIQKIETSSGKKESVAMKGEMVLNKARERAYIFDHAWRQVTKKFYVEDLHGVDWEFYKTAYQRFLPHINNNYDFAEMLSELLGELNASHTGGRYSHRPSNPDATAALGAFYDHTFTGDGLKVVEIIAKGPLDKANSAITPGTIIEKIDGEAITANVNYYPLLNRKEDTPTLLSLFDPATKKRWEEVVKPISLGEENNILYHRWVKSRRDEVERLSEGKIGYVHVRGMNDPSYRQVYEEILGRHANKAAIIVDTRFNGGGWLHDDLATFLDGKVYIEMMPRGQKIGSEPMFKWTKPSSVLVGESNYSDAHMFPYAYRAAGIGQIIGMPVPGTGTAVWWEQQIDPTLVFGIPQVGMVDTEGDYLENKQLEPDVKVRNEPEALIKGVDQQLVKAVELLLQATK